MILIVCGDRNWTDEYEILRFLKGLLLEFSPDSVTLVHGNCRGADEISGMVGHELGFTVIPVDADWKAFGLAAGPIRNQLMIDKYHPNMIVGFHNDYEHSKGTKDMLMRAKKANIYTVLISSYKITTIHSKRLTIRQSFLKEYLDKINMPEEEREKLC